MGELIVLELSTGLLEILDLLTASLLELLCVLLELIKLVLLIFKGLVEILHALS